MGADNNSLDEILSEAIDRPAAERQSYLISMCGEDHQKLEEAQSLLAAYERSADFMEQPATINVVGMQADDDWIGRAIGEYKMIELIGSGGTGRVYLAERTEREFVQRVAVKIIRRGAMGAEVIRRFRNECRVLAMLEHPNIARMIDGGTTDDGTPFIVMEYVDGTPIDEFCFNSELSLGRRLDLFRDVCGAVQMVHKHSTIHRDIKPSNILVTTDGQAKLVDFGIARVLDVAEQHMDLTATGLELMTPQYASPEQLRGDMLSTSTDVYSLGVVLFKILTGRLPFFERSRQALEKLVLTVEPTRPSDIVGEMTEATTAVSDTRRRARELRGDLDTIILMALRKEPERRYASVDQLSEDIRRHLSGQPVLAQPDTFRYRSRKFVRRNFAAVVATLAMVVVLVVATAVSVVMFSRAENQRQLAVESRSQLELEVAKSRATNEFLKEMLSSADPGSQGRDVRVADLLEPALVAASEQFTDQPEVLAELQSTIGMTYYGLGLFSEAVVVYQELYELQISIYGEDHPETWWALKELGSAISDSEDFERAEPMLKSALAGLRRGYGDEHDRTGHCMTDLALLWTFMGQYENSEKLTLEALEIRRRVWGASYIETLILMNNLGFLYQSMQRYDEAEPIQIEALEKLIEVLGPEHPHVLVSYANMVTLYYHKGGFDRAEKYAQLAWETQVRVLGEGHPDVLVSLNNLAYMQNIQGNREGAAESFALLVSLAEASEVDLEFTQTVAEGNYGEILVALERFVEAEIQLEASYSGFIDLVSRDDKRTERAINRLVVLYEAWGKPDQASIWRDRLSK
ncbi:MAG: serine/threonine protein kinase [Candidatus Krumholzibacteriia bacterium]|jgi:serine/threonine protein kinase